jgi:hypothetical protein
MIIVDTSGLRALTQKLQRASRNFPRDAARALSSTQRATRTEATRAMAEVYTAGRRRLGAGLRVSNVDKAALAFTITGSRAPIQLQDFQHRANSRGVQVQVLRSGGMQSLPSAFRADVGGRGRLFQRAVRNGARVGRLPIKLLFGPSVADMLTHKQVGARITVFASRKLGAELIRLTQAALRNG